jgi:hypothetical protein
MDTYIRRGILQGNTDIPKDITPSLVGNGVFVLNESGDYIIDGMITDQIQSARMVISSNPFGEPRSDIMVFNSNKLADILTTVRAINLVTPDNVVSPVYQAEFVNSSIVISAPNSSLLKISGVIAPGLNNAADYLGFYSQPDPRSVSESLELSSSPPRDYAPSNNKTSYISKFEDRTSASINRAVDSIALNVEDLYLRSRVHKKNAMSCRRVSVGAMSFTRGYAIYSYLESVNGFATTCADLHNYPEQNYFQPSPTFSAAVENTGSLTPLSTQAALIDEDSQSSVFSDTHTESLTKTKSMDVIDRFGNRIVFENNIILTKSLDDIERRSASCDGNIFQSGYVTYAGYFCNENIVKDGIQFIVEDQVTIKLDTDLSDDLIAICSAGALISLNNGSDLDYGYKITHVIGKNRLIVEPVLDIEHRLAPVSSKQLRHNLTPLSTGAANIYLGDSVPAGFFAVLLVSEDLGNIEIKNSLFRIDVVPETRTYFPEVNYNGDEEQFIAQMNSANNTKVIDSLSAALSGNVSNRSAQSKLFKNPYIERLLETNTDFSYGNNMISSILKCMTADIESVTLRQEKILLYGILGVYVYSALQTGVVPPQIQADIKEIAEELLLDQNYGIEGQIYFYADGTSMIINSTSLANINYASTSKNPVVLLVLLLLADITPFLASASGLVCESDGYLRKLNTFRSYDVGREFVVTGNGTSLLCKMVEYVSDNVARFVEVSTGKNLRSGAYSIVGCRGPIMQQAYETSYGNLDSVTIDSGSYDLKSVYKLASSRLLLTQQDELVIDTGLPMTYSSGSALLLTQLPKVANFDFYSTSNELDSLFLSTDNLTRSARYNNGKKCVVYLECVINTINYSGFYTISAVRPIFDTTGDSNIPSIALVIGSPLGDTLYTRLMGSDSYDLKSSVLTASEISYSNNIYTYAGDDNLSGVDIHNLNICETMRSPSHISEKNNTATISNQSITIESGITPSFVAAILTNTTAKKPTAMITVQDQLEEHIPAPVVIIDDGNKLPPSTPTFNTSNIIGERAYSYSPTILLSKSNSGRDTAIQITTGSLSTAKSDIALLSIEDVYRNSGNTDNYGRETDTAISSVGNNAFTGLSRFDSDYRDSQESVTNYRGSGKNKTGGIDSHLNPSTSGRRMTGDTEENESCFTNNLTTNEFVPARYSHPKYLGEASTIFQVASPPVVLLQPGQGGGYPAKISIPSIYQVGGADINRSVTLYAESSDGDRYTKVGIVSDIDVDNNAFVVIFKTTVENMVSLPIKDRRLYIHGREWLLNADTANISNKASFRDYIGQEIFRIKVVDDYADFTGNFRIDFSKITGKLLTKIDNIRIISFSDGIDVLDPRTPMVPVKNFDLRYTPYYTPTSIGGFAYYKEQSYKDATEGFNINSPTHKELLSMDYSEIPEEYRHPGLESIGQFIAPPHGMRVEPNLILDMYTIVEVPKSFVPTGVGIPNSNIFGSDMYGCGYGSIMAIKQGISPFISTAVNHFLGVVSPFPGGGYQVTIGNRAVESGSASYYINYLYNSATFNFDTFNYYIMFSRKRALSGTTSSVGVHSTEWTTFCLASILGYYNNIDVDSESQECTITSHSAQNNQLITFDPTAVLKYHILTAEYMRDICNAVSNKVYERFIDNNNFVYKIRNNIPDLYSPIQSNSPYNFIEALRLLLPSTADSSASINYIDSDGFETDYVIHNTVHVNSGGMYKDIRLLSAYFPGLSTFTELFPAATAGWYELRHDQFNYPKIATFGNTLTRLLEDSYITKAANTTPYPDVLPVTQFGKFLLIKTILNNYYDSSSIQTGNLNKVITISIKNIFKKKYN